MGCVRPLLSALTSGGLIFLVVTSLVSQNFLVPKTHFGRHAVGLSLDLISSFTLREQDVQARLGSHDPTVVCSLRFIKEPDGFGS